MTGTNKLVYHINMVNGYNEKLWESLSQESEGGMVHSYITSTNKLVYHIDMVNGYKKILWESLSKKYEVEMVHSYIMIQGTFFESF